MTMRIEDLSFVNAKNCNIGAQLGELDSENGERPVDVFSKIQ